MIGRGAAEGLIDWLQGGWKIREVKIEKWFFIGVFAGVLYRIYTL
jgi:hypothetical protein